MKHAMWLLGLALLVLAQQGVESPWRSRGTSARVWSNMSVGQEFDVPAIEEIRPARFPCNLTPTGSTACTTGDESYWTCADKSRVLLQAEDGTRHCISLRAPSASSKPEGQK